jgi:hypothetical protein
MAKAGAFASHTGGQRIATQVVDGVPHFEWLQRLMDLEMLAISTNGRERTEREFADLLAKAGLALARVVPTQSPYSVLEAVRA